MVGRPVFNAVGGSLTGVTILVLIIMVIWYLKRLEKEKKKLKQVTGSGSRPEVKELLSANKK